MNITEFAVKNTVITWLSVVLLCIAGVASYFSLGKLEDPEYTVKTAAIVTQYPGASPVEVETEISDVIESAIQEIPEVDYIESISRQGLSIVKVEISSTYWSDKLPQIWDSLRRKIRNIEGSLPPGASRPDISDDFGDVYGFVIALTGDGYSYDQLEAQAKDLKKKLSLLDGVARVEFWGKVPRAVYLNISETKLAELGISLESIANELSKQNAVTASGNLYFNDSTARIELAGDFNALADIGNITLRSGPGNQLIKLSDIADVEMAFIEPPTQMMRYNGQDAIGLSISNISGTNIITLGQTLRDALADMRNDMPVGMETHEVAWQEQQVSEAISSFNINLIEAIVIVLVVLAVSMGWQMGIVIGTALVLTIMGTLVFMALLGIDLQRMSLGALVIALGMMVDNAIVVADGIVVRLQKGMDRTKAAIEAATKPALPLLGATIIAVLAFYPIGGSKDSTGEYCLSLFQVVGISLMFSWLVSVTVTPLQCLAMLKSPDKEGDSNSNDPYQSSFYRTYRGWLTVAIRHRVLTMVSLLGLLVMAVIGFGNVSQSFFPDSSRPQFMIDMYAVTGTRIYETSEKVKKAEEKIMQMDGVTAVSSFIGSGPPRFYLPVEPELFFASYAQMIVSVDDFRKVDKLKAEIEPWLAETFPEVPVFRVRKYAVGPGNTWKFEVRLNAPPTASRSELRSIAEQGLAIVQHHPWVLASQLDWREQAPKAVLDYDQDRGRLASLTRQDVAAATSRAFDGSRVGLFRDGDELFPILMRNEGNERNDPSSLYDIQIAQATTGQSVPLSQVVSDIHMAWEDPLIWRRDRLRTITIQAEPIDGVTLPTLRADVLDEFNKFEQSLPPGYFIEWGAEYESSADAQAALVPGIIPALALMFFMVVALFNSLKPAAIIFMTIPFALIGISIGLLSTGASFGFMALLGAMSLAGMMIKNAVVLIDEIRLNIDEQGMRPYDALIAAGLSRLRPVALAAATTVLGVIPLIQDVFWVSMAVTIMAGLAFGTILTMIAVPVLYSMFYGISESDKTDNTKRV